MRELLLFVALISSGFRVDSPLEFGQGVFTIIEQVLGADGAPSNGAPIIPDRVVEAEQTPAGDPWKK